jgi:hypothetical protein
MNCALDVVHTPKRHVVRDRLVDDAQDARTDRQAALGHEVRGDLRLGLVQRKDELILRRIGIGACGPAELVEISAHALLAAGHQQQLGVEFDAPLRIDAHGCERPVEAHAVAVALGIHEHAVTVENDCLEGHGSRGPQAALARTSVARFVPPNSAIFDLNSALQA